MFFNRNFLNALLYLALAGLVLWVFSDIVIYIILSLILSGILKTPTNYLSQTGYKSFRLPRGVAILLSFAIFASIISLFVLLFIPLISEQVQVIATTPYDTWFNGVLPMVNNVEKMLIDFNLIDQPRGFIMLQLKSNLSSVFSKLQFGEIVNNVLATTGSVFVGVLAVLFITFFILFEKGSLRRNLIALIPNKYFEVTISAFYKTEKLLSNYLLGLLMQVTAIFTLTSFGLIVANINYAVTIGVFAALVNVIPFLGPAIGTVFALVIGLATAPAEVLADGGYGWVVAKILFVQGLVHLIDNVVLQPLIFSKSVKTHPLEIFIVVIAGAILGGAVGMVAAIPSYTILRVSFMELRKGFREYRIFQNLKTSPAK
jgi:predicted PurR-regulated permease PerM